MAEQGDAGGALRALATATRILPGSRRQHELAVEVYAKVLESIGQIAEAESHVREGLSALGDSPTLWALAGRLAQADGRPIDAVRCFTTATELDPRCFEAWTNWGAVLNGLGRFEDALPCHDHAVLLRPTEDIAWVNRAAALMGLGRARETAESCSHVRNGTFLSWYLLGRANLVLGQPGQAVEALKRAIALDQSKGFAWNDYSSALASVGNRVEAARAASMGRKLG